MQRARDLALDLNERFGDFRFLIRDRGSNFTASFDAVFQAAGTTILQTAVQAPRMNATCERLVGTLRREILDRVLILGEAHLHTVLTEYQVHYNTARPHRGHIRTRPGGPSSTRVVTLLPAPHRPAANRCSVRSATTTPWRASKTPIFTTGTPHSTHPAI